MYISDKLFQLTCRCFGFKVFDFRLPISSNIYIQLLLLPFRMDHPSARGEQEGTQPQGVDLRHQQKLCEAEDRPIGIRFSRQSFT